VAGPRILSAGAAFLLLSAPSPIAAAPVSGPTAPAEGTGTPVRLEFHFKPVANLQIAIWIEDEAGNFVRDVFVTQATGKLGIGNRPGLWDFLSSWRAPYGPRPMVLPVWAHRRGKTYPKLVFFDDNPADQTSLGWHENSSSTEPYFCRPLTPDEHETIATDTMTCPSPSAFRSDKGRFHETDVSVYPPRNDLVEVHPTLDSPDVAMFAELNDLDAVTGATPPGETEVVRTIMLDDVPDGNLVAYIEVSLEADENPSYDFTREDHFIDPRLTAYGVEFFGQPSVVYRVTFDPKVRGFTGTSEYAGYGEWDGTSGTLYPPDETISVSGGSGADRLRLYTKNGETFRFGVFSDGVGGGGGDTGGDTGGWTPCTVGDLPPVADMAAEAMDFDKVQLSLVLPVLEGAREVQTVRVFYRPGTMPIDDSNVSQAVEVPCTGPYEPGQPVTCLVDQLFGNTEYQVAVRYEDTCGNQSPLVAASVQTPAQEFSIVDGFCVVATAAYGAPWAPRVYALRLFRDQYLLSNPLGRGFVALYYEHGPLLARAIADSPWGRSAVRAILGPIADLALVTTRAHEPRG